jgi:hypothetical protein
MPVYDDTQILAFVADMLKVAVANLPGYYAASLVPRGHLSGYQEVLGILLRRGFTMAQALGFDRLGEFEQSLSLFFILSDAGTYRRVDDRTLEALDRRKELETVVVFINGLPVAPLDASDATDLAGQGDLDTSQDLFVMDSDDPRIGQVTRW